MDYRIGTCSQCGAEYKVPASFAHSQARCKKCPGTVNLGPPAGAEAPKPAPMPAKKVVSKPKPMQKVSTEGAEGKRKERGTLAKLRAERAAADKAKGTAAPKPAAKPAAAPKSEEQTPTEVTPHKKVSVTPAAGKSRPSRSGGKSSRTRSKGKDDGEAGSGRRGRSRPEKKKSPAGLIVVGLIVVAGAVYGGMTLLGGSDETPKNESQAAETSADDAELAAAEQAAANADQATKDQEAADALAAEKAAEAGAGAAEEVEAKEQAPKKVDVIVDLAALERCKRARGTTDEEWEEMNGWVVDFLDPDSGAAGLRAGKKLGKLSRKAMPVLINGLMTLDYTDEEAINTGDALQRMLKTIANGNSFGWFYFDNPRHLYGCNKTVEAWQKAWKQVESNIEAYIKLAKLDQEYSGDDEDPIATKRARWHVEAAELRSKYANAE